MRHRLAKHSHVIDKHFSMLPSPELRRRNIDRYHNNFSLRENFSRKQMAKWACDTIASNMYVDRPLPRTGCLLRAQYNGYALHCGAQYNGYALYCAQLKGNPHWKKILSFVNFSISTSYAEAGQGNGEPYNITDGDFVVGNITECSQYLGV